MISISDGFLIFLIKLPDLRYNPRHSINPFLAKLLSVCDEQLHQVVSDDHDRLAIRQYASTESLSTNQKAKKSLTSIFKSVKNRVVKKVASSTQLKLKASTLKLNQFEKSAQHSSASESSDDDEPITNRELDFYLSAGKLNFSSPGPPERVPVDSSLANTRAQIIQSFRSMLSNLSTGGGYNTGIMRGYNPGIMCGYNPGIMYGYNTKHPKKFLRE